MSKFILGAKIGMTQIFDADGVCIPVTVIQAEPCVVIQKKTTDTDSYNAIKIGAGKCELKKLNKPEAGVFSKLGEFRTDATDEFEVGKEIGVSIFSDGDCVDVSGTSKGKGFQGAIKRHGQKIGPKSHGSKYHRGVGSMGPNTDPGKVFKGKKMPGHMGSETVTVQNLSIVKVDGERNLLLIKGAVPGAKGSLLEISQSVKA